MNIPLRPISPVGCMEGVQFSLSLLLLMHVCLSFLLRAGTGLPSWGSHLYPHFLITSSCSISSARFHLASRILSFSSTSSRRFRPESRFRASRIFHLVHLICLIQPHLHLRTGNSLIPSAKLSSRRKNGKVGSPSSSTGASPQAFHSMGRPCSRSCFQSCPQHLIWQPVPILSSKLRSSLDPAYLCQAWPPTPPSPVQSLQHTGCWR